MAPRAPFVRETSVLRRRRNGMARRLYPEGASGSKRLSLKGAKRLDKRAAIVLAVIFGGLFAVLFGFMFLAWSAVKTATGNSGLDETSVGARIGIIEAKEPSATEARESTPTR